MKTSFYAGASGLTAQQQAMNVIGANVANANTDGYQKQGVSFDSLLYQQMYANTAQNPLNGVGVRAVSTGLMTGQHPVRETGHALDFAVVGDAFFAVDHNGQREYTRDGAFAIRLENGNAYLSTQDGFDVLNGAGGRITMPKKADGSYDYAALTDQIGLYRFAYAGALEPLSYNRYAPTASSGAAQPSSDSKLMNGYLEASGVSMVDEMSDMIAAQRAYQMSAKVVQTADENEQVINNLRK